MGFDTIQRAQGLGIVELDASRGRFEEAVQGLKNNLTFLQEMVEIYCPVGIVDRITRFELPGWYCRCVICSDVPSQNVQLQHEYWIRR